MSIADNKRIVRAFFAHFGRSDVAGLLRYLAEDATWWVNGKPHLFSSAGTKTKAEAGMMLRAMFGAFVDGIDIQVTAMIGEGDRVAAEARSVATTTSGRRYSNDYHFAFTFRDGLISSLREYTDLLHVKEIVG